MTRIGKSPKSTSTIDKSLKLTNSFRNMSNSDLSSITSKETSTPSCDKRLIRACKKNVSLQKIQHIVKKNPDSVKCLNSSDQTALHVACSEGLPVEVINFLSSKYPQACLMKDKSGKFPLHYVAVHHKWTAEPKECIAEIGMFEYIASARGSYRFCSEEVDRNRAIAATERLEKYKEMLRNICDLNQSASIEVDNDGHLPIEYSLRDKSSMDVVKIFQCTAVRQRRSLLDRP